MNKENEFREKEDEGIDISHHIRLRSSTMSSAYQIKFDESSRKNIERWGSLIKHRHHGYLITGVPGTGNIPFIWGASWPETVEDYEAVFKGFEVAKESTERRPVSQVIDELQRENKELSRELSIKESQIRKLKQILREAFRPKILKRFSIHGSVLSFSSLLISFVYGFNLMHPILASPLLLVSIVFLIISRGLEKSEKALV